ncbi:MAG: hypothetical protein GY850_42110 [bacterium]|nr:hypothetical protein [bacterium]
MDTEPVASPDRSPKNIRQKILNYQAIFRNGFYKRYGKIFNTKFNGFRLLFLTNSPTRLASLSRLVQEMPPSDFIWLTNQEKMFSDGSSAEIWVRGGKTDRPPQSIIRTEFGYPNPGYGQYQVAWDQSEMHYNLGYDCLNCDFGPLLIMKTISFLNLYSSTPPSD